MLEQLALELADKGYQGRVVSIEHLRDLEEAIEGPRRQGLLDAGLYRTYLAELCFRAPEALPDARSIIIVSTPQPQVRVTFVWAGLPVPTIVPPTYPEREMDSRILALLRGCLEPAGFRLAPAALPKKMLAVRTGLAVYGKNNVTYVPGLGSFHGLVAAYSDLPVAEDVWQEPQMMERCETCVACQRRCPTGAIGIDRFLLRAERCLTYHNEKPPTVPFPAWVDSGWHNCLVGCLRCQWICPENKEAKQRVQDGVTFSEEETERILMGGPLAELPPRTLSKLRSVNLEQYADLLPRNLKSLLAITPVSG